MREAIHKTSPIILFYLYAMSRIGNSTETESKVVVA